MGTRKKRPNGDGSIYQTADGRWRAVVSAGTVDGKRKRLSRLCRTREDARLALLELRGAAVSHTPDHLTLETYMQDWLTHHVGQSCEESTAAGYRFAWERHLAPVLGSLLLSGLTALQVEQAFRQLATGDRTKQHAFAVLSSALSRAVRLGVLSRNPCEVLERPRCRQEPIEPFTLDEMRRILAESADHRLAVVFVLALTVGLRQGEIFGLRWEDVDWTAGTLRIARQAREFSGKVGVAEPKTAAGIRTIKLSPQALAAVQARRVVALREGLGACPWVCPSRSGGLMGRCNFGSRHWRPLLKKLGIRLRGLHHARHTAASLLLGSGVPVHVVSQVLGHARPSITLDLYAHLMPHQSDAAAAAMSKLVGGAG